MYDLLKELFEGQQLITIYDDANDNDSFYVGKIVALTNQAVIILIATKEGFVTGYYYTQLVNIVKITYDGKYENKIKLLCMINSSDFSNSFLFEGELLQSILLIAKTNGFIVTLCNTQEDLFHTGLVLDVKTDIIKIQEIDNYAQMDGISIIQSGYITKVTINGLYERALSNMLAYKEN
ncbi:MAG: hypothetical protein ACC608_07960 [Anaerofustis sp.]